MTLLIKSIKKFLDTNELGQIFSVIAENGSYMPDWHPGENYQISYASNKKLGGGGLLDLGCYTVSSYLNLFS